MAFQPIPYIYLCGWVKGGYFNFEVKHVIFISMQFAFISFIACQATRTFCNLFEFGI